MKSLLLFCLLITVSYCTSAQCPTPDITASGPTTFCAGDSVALSTPTGNTWTKISDVRGSSRDAGISFSIGSKGYIGTGNNGYDGFVSTDFWEYDPEADMWTQKANFAGARRSYATGFCIGSKGYVGLGSFEGTDPKKDFWEYDPAANQWTRKADFGGGERSQATGFSIGTKGYIGTGDRSNSTNYYKDFWEYDPVADNWTRKADFGGEARHFATGFSIGNKGYIGLGNTGLFAPGYNPDSFKDFWEYDPAADNWTRKSDFGGEARFGAAGLNVGNKGYIGVGLTSNFNALKDFWEYDPTANSWKKRADYGGAGRGFAAAFSIGSKGYIGTGIIISGDRLDFVKDFWKCDIDYTYLWSTGETTFSINVTTPGNYTIKTTHASGCSATSEATDVTLKPATRITTQPKNTFICKGSSVIFTVAATGNNLTYKWYKDGQSARSDNNSSTLTIDNTLSSDAGSYTVDVTSDCGTVTSNAAALTVNSPTTPVVTVTNNCGSSMLSTTATGTLLWNTGATTSSITVSNAGNYTVTQTVNGCISEEGSGTAAPKMAPSIPVVTVTNNCGSSILSTTATGTLLWNTGATTPSITVSNAGNYTVTQTVNGCISEEGSGTAAPKMAPSIPTVTVTNNCSSSILSTTATGSLLWSTGATTPSITVSNAGNYTVTQTVNGCISEEGSGTAAPKAALAKPVITANGSTTFCQGGSVILSAPTGFTYLWSNNATGPSITVSASGSYSVTVTNAGGCSSTSDAVTVSVINDTQKPVVTCPTATAICYVANETYALAALQATDNCTIASTSYVITGATSRSGTGANASGVFKPGTSTIIWTVKDAAGNTSTCQSSVIVNEKFSASIPDGWALGSGCTLNTVYKGYAPASYILLIAKPVGGKSPYTYKWSNWATASFILVNPATATTYTVTVKDVKGCTQSASKQISVVDVRCGSKMDKVTLCYKGVTKCIEQKDVADYLLKGAYLGSCRNAASKPANEIVEQEVKEESDLSVKASPNPSTAFFRLTINSSNVKDKVSISVVDEVGRPLETRTASAGQTIQIGDRYRAGMYFAQAIQGSKRVTVKLIKQAW